MKRGNKFVARWRTGYIISMKKFLFFVLLIPFFSPFLRAQEGKAIVKLMPFAIQGLGTDEAKILETLIQSYIIDLGDTINYQAVTDQTSPQNGSPNPDIIITGSITLSGDERILKLELVNTQTGEITQYTSSHKTTSDLALKSRALVQEALAVNYETAQEREESEPIQEQKVAVTWKGDKGIELIRLQRGGTGIAVFSSGAQMMLSYSIRNNVLTVTQTSPNVDRFYHPVPYTIAKQLVQVAEPMVWELKLYNNGMILRGTKKSTAVEYEGDTVKAFLFGTVRDAEWTKMK